MNNKKNIIVDCNQPDSKCDCNSAGVIMKNVVALNMVVWSCCVAIVGIVMVFCMLKDNVTIQSAL